MLSFLRDRAWSSVNGLLSDLGISD